MENLVFNYFMPTKILFGPGSLDRLKDENLPGKKALIVISAGTSMKKYGYLDRLTAIYVALANTLAGFVESTSSCTSEHSMEHALSAFYPDLPHGAGLIMLSEAYHTFFASKVPQKYVQLAKAMGVDVDSLPEDERPFAFVKAMKKLQEECGVGNLKMSDYGIEEDEIEKLADNAIKTMGGLFEVDPYKLSFEETVQIMKNAYK